MTIRTEVQQNAFESQMRTFKFGMVLNVLGAILGTAAGISISREYDPAFGVLMYVLTGGMYLRAVVTDVVRLIDNLKRYCWD